MNVDGVTAVVTGGASGLGAATARALREKGADVFVLDLPGARERVDEALATFLECDVTQPDQVDAAVARAAEGGNLRVCVNCAGVGIAERTIGRDGSPAALDAGEVLQIRREADEEQVDSLRSHHLEESSPSLGVVEHASILRAEAGSTSAPSGSRRRA